MEVIPGILEKEWSEIEKKIQIAKQFSKVMHIDLLDGKFAENTTFQDPTPFKKYSNDIFFELHMMVDNPLQYIKPWADAGIKRFLGHIEKMPDQVAFVAQGQLLGEVGIYIDGPTALDVLTVPLNDLDVIGIFTAKKAGFSGQPFEASLLKKVKAIREKSAYIPIEVDGGINDQTIVQAKATGATRFVATSFLFKENTPKEQYQKLRSCLR